MYKKSNNIYIFLSLCLICLLIIGVYFFPEKTDEAAYTLKEYSGSLAVFTTDGSIIESINDSNIASLPPDDREKLKKGITVFSEEELISLIEDFLG